MAHLLVDMWQPLMASLRHTNTTNNNSTTILTYNPDESVQEITLVGLLLGAALLGVNIIISAVLHLGLQFKIAVGTLRSFLQLSLLGYILLPIFKSDKLWLSAVYCLFMLCVAAIEAVSRPKQTYDGMLLQVLGVLGVVAGPVITYSLIFVVGVEPWYEAQYLIPMLGMMLGNACSGVAVGLSAVLDELSSGKDKVEQLLAMGATRLEATHTVIKQAVRMSFTPILNSMNVVGIVSIPGMMTGQILGGNDPQIAARYQIVILYMIGSASGIASVIAIFAAVLSVCDSKHRLHADMLHARSNSSAGAIGWIGAQSKTVWGKVKRKVDRIRGRLSVVSASSSAAASRGAPAYNYGANTSSSSTSRNSGGGQQHSHQFFNFRRAENAALLQRSGVSDDGAALLPTTTSTTTTAPTAVVDGGRSSGDRAAGTSSTTSRGNGNGSRRPSIVTPLNLPARLQEVVVARGDDDYSGGSGGSSSGGRSGRQQEQEMGQLHEPLLHGGSSTPRSS